MRQVAALPYRSDDAAVGGEVQILLVTSRQTRRWVIPKGNHDAGMDAHTGAAIEAEEEGGVRGSIAEAPIGSYRYRKRRGLFLSPVIEVDVFPLAVSDELPEWKEQHERERRWFSLSAAADAVEEPSLRDLIRAFAGCKPNTG